MIYYPHYISDFNNATRHLTRTERSIYRDLLDIYYETEKQLTLDFKRLCKLAIAHSNEEVTAVEQVLNEFFTETPTGWFHVRCDEEILHYHKNTSQKSNAGKASAAAREARRQQALNGNPTDVERTLNGTSTNQNQNQNQNQNKSIESLTTTETNSTCMSTQPAPTPKKATRLPENWVLPQSWGEWALSERPDLTHDDVRLMAEMFRDHWIANASRATGKKDDWQATWRNWVRKSPPNRAGVPRGGTPYHEKISDTMNQIFGKKQNGSANTIIDITPSEADGSGAADIPAVYSGIRT